MLATLGWGLLGAVLAYAIPFELVLAVEWMGGQRWLPGQLLGLLAEGGSTVSSYGRIGLLLSVYAVATTALAAVLFSRRDITS